MAWLWWLLAPVCSTILGATLLWLRGCRESRAVDPMAEYRILLSALSSPEAAGEPATMVLLEPADTLADDPAATPTPATPTPAAPTPMRPTPAAPAAAATLATAPASVAAATPAWHTAPVAEPAGRVSPA